MTRIHKKICKIGRKKFDHFLTLRRHDHVITIPPISQAGVGNSEIATVILKRIPLGSLSQKMSEIGLVVWAVGGVPYVLVPAHLLFRSNLYSKQKYPLFWSDAIFFAFSRNA